MWTTERASELDAEEREEKEEREHVGLATERQAYSNGIEMIIEAGYSKPMSAITITSKQEIRSTLKLHYMLFRNKACMDQLKSGLAALGVLDAKSQYFHILDLFFQGGWRDPLTAGIYMYNFVLSHIHYLLCIGNPIVTDGLKNILEVHYLDPGTSQRVKKEATYIYTCIY